MDEIWEARRVKLQAEAKAASLALLDHMNGAQRVKMTVQGRTDAKSLVIALGAGGAGAEVYLRDAHEGQNDECWVPCAKGDPGAVLFVSAE